MPSSLYDFDKTAFFISSVSNIWLTRIGFSFLLTGLEQLEKDRQFSSLKKFLDQTKNLDEADRKLGGLTIKQARLFAQYYQRKEDREKKLETRIKQAPKAAAEIRYRKIYLSHKLG